MKLPYRPELKQLARELRNHSTIAEVLLWKHLKNGQRMGIDFHRQKPIGRYIVDFFAPKLMLAVEIDGDTHRFKIDDDTNRQKTLERLGVHFLRFGHTEVVKNPLGAALAIDRWIEAHESQRIATQHTPPCGHPS